MPNRLKLSISQSTFSLKDNFSDNSFPCVSYRRRPAILMQSSKKNLAMKYICRDMILKKVKERFSNPYDVLAL